MDFPSDLRDQILKVHGGTTQYLGDVHDNIVSSLVKNTALILYSNNCVKKVFNNVIGTFKNIHRITNSNIPKSTYLNNFQQFFISQNDLF